MGIFDGSFSVCKAAYALAGAGYKITHERRI